MTTNGYEKESRAKAGWPGLWLAAATNPVWDIRKAAWPGASMVLVLRGSGPRGQGEPQPPLFPNRMVPYGAG